MYHILKYQEQYQFNEILSIMIINKIQESYIHLFQINHLVVYQKFLQKIILSNKYSQKLLHTAKKSTTDAIKTASKRAIQKTSEATGHLTGNKISDKITNASNKFSKKLHSEKEANNEKPKDRYICPGKKDNKLSMN